MRKTKSTKQALLLSALSLLLCISMLVGTTFAWFTDSVSTGNNIIAAGNLDVELYWSTDCATWTKVDVNTNVFEKTALWEPGHTEVVYLKVANEGSLYLKYQLGVNVVSEITSTAVTGEPLKLSEHILYGVVEADAKYASRDDARKDVTNATKLAEAYSSDVITLAPAGQTGAEETVALVVYMPEEVSNEANHAKGAKVPTINLGLNVLATQKDAEMDSFGSDYDKDALFAVGDGLYMDKTDGSYVALSNQGLYTASELASADPSVTSVTYVSDKWTVEVPVIASAAALSTAVSNKEEMVVLTSGTYSVSGGMENGQEIDIVGNKNTVINIFPNCNPAEQGAIVNFSGVTINASGYANGLGNGTKATYTDCTLSTQDMYLFNDTSFINCVFNDTGSYALWTWGARKVEFIGCTFNTTGKALYVNASSVMHQTVIITDCKFYDTGVNNTQKAAIETGDDYGGRTYDIIITNTTVDGFAVTEDKTSSKNYGGNNLGTNVWGNKYQMGTDKLNVVIDGVDVY